MKERVPNRKREREREEENDVCELNERKSLNTGKSFALFIRRLISTLTIKS